MTADLQQFRYDNLLRRVGNIIGPGSKVKEVLSELFPVLDVERVPGELLWLSGWRLAWGGDQKSSAAGETSRVELFNPADSGKIVVCTAFIATVATVSSVVWTTRNSALPDTTSPELLRDTRSGATEKPSGQIFTQSAAGSTVGTNRVLMLGNTPLQIKDVNAVAVLFPGTGLEVGMTSQQSILNVSFNWRERTFEPSELTGV